MVVTVGDGLGLILEWATVGSWVCGWVDGLILEWVLPRKVFLGCFLLVGYGWVFSWVMGYGGGWVASSYGFCGWLWHGSLWVVLILNLGFVPSCAVG